MEWIFLIGFPVGILINELDRELRRKDICINFDRLFLTAIATTLVVILLDWMPLLGDPK